MTCDYPIAAGDGHDFPRLIDERVPGVAAVIDDVVEGFENSVRQPVLPHELPDIFLAVEFGWQQGRSLRTFGMEVAPIPLTNLRQLDCKSGRGWQGDQSRPLRVSSRTPAASRRAISRKAVELNFMKPARTAGRVPAGETLCLAGKLSPELSSPDTLLAIVIDLMSRLVSTAR